MRALKIAHTDDPRRLMEELEAQARDALDPEKEWPPRVDDTPVCDSPEVVRAKLAAMGG